MSDREGAKQRAIFLKRLREEHQTSVAEAQALLKVQQAFRRKICEAMRDGPKTVPEIAATAGLPADQTLWHVMAMKKYDLVTEAGMCGEYYLYQMPKEKKQ